MFVCLCCEEADGRRELVDAVLQRLPLAAVDMALSVLLWRLWLASCVFGRWRFVVVALLSPSPSRALIFVA